MFASDSYLRVHIRLQLTQRCVYTLVALHVTRVLRPDVVQRTHPPFIHLDRWGGAGGLIIT